jgi:hypothetical protein
MRHRRSYLLAVAIFSALFWLPSCGRNSPAEEQRPPAAAPVSDGSPIVSETMGRIKTRTYSATVNISKVYKNGLRYDDVLRIYSKLDEQGRTRVLLSVKPQGERKGFGMLAEMRDKEIISAHRLIPESKQVVPLNPKRKFSNVVIGGLNLEDFQLVQGVSPFAEARVAGREEVNGKACDALDVIFPEQSQYHHGRLFTTAAERLPVLLRTYNQEGAPLKEVVFDKLEQVDGAWAVKQLTVVERSFDYTSTFNFGDIQVNAPLDDSIFTTDYLLKGWQEPRGKSRRP